MDKDELKNKLSPEVFAVTQEGATEPAFSGKFYKHKETGMYTCTVCGAKLFSSDTKFDSGTGWPSFDSPANHKAVELRPDNSHGMQRTEVVCKNCGAHLGHIFDDGPQETTGKRYCINSCALDFDPTDTK